MDPPEGNYIAWTLPGATAITFLAGAEAWLYHREGDPRTAVQLRVHVRGGGREFRVLLNRQADRSYVGRCVVIATDSLQPEAVCLLTRQTILNADSMVDRGLALGELEWLSPAGETGHWMGYFRQWKRAIVDPNSYRSPHEHEDDPEID